MLEKLLKGGVAGVVTIIAFATDSYTPLIPLLVFFEVADYVAGMFVAWLENGWDSKTAIIGFFKKLFYYVLIGVAFGMDYMILETTHIFGWELEYNATFGILAVCWLLSTEAISILENLEEIGVTVPFVTAALRTFRERIKEKGD